MELTEAELDKEISQLIKYTNYRMSEWYVKVRPHLRVKVLNQHDELRHEICKCMVFGLWHASITATNHLLERFIKYSLIEHEADFEKIESIEFFDTVDFVVSKYDGKTLEFTINAACTLGIITRDEKKKLIKFKDKFRNAYSHAETKKMFKDEPPVPVRLDHLGNIDIEKKTGNILAENCLPWHGQMLEDIAKRDCFEYFEAVDNIIIRIEFEKNPELLNYNGLKWVDRPKN